MTLLNDGALTDAQMPATASHLCTTGARLDDVGQMPPPNKNPGYACDFDGSERQSKSNTC